MIFLSVFVENMNVNRGEFGSVMWINVKCIETVDNAAVFTVLIYDSSCTAVQVRRCINVLC
jgi:hypothetical protein